MSLRSVRRTIGFAVIFLLTAMPVVKAFALPTIDGCQVFPTNNVWNVPIDTVPLHGSSATFVATIGAAAHTHMDFGSGLYLGRPIGIPFVTVSGAQSKVPISFLYAGESDVGPYPLPTDVPIEGGASDPSGDRHALVLDRDTCKLYEVYRAFQTSPNLWHGDSGAVFDLNSHALRPAGWTSADAAGLPILPGLLRYDEVNSGEITHAVRFTVPNTRNTYVWPARHKASSLTDTVYPEMGQRFRLRADYPEVKVPPWSSHALTIIHALKKYGMILADNGSAWYISGAPDARWNNTWLHELDAIVGSDYQAVDTSTLQVSANSAQTNVSLTVSGTANGPDGALSGVTFCTPAGIVCSATDGSGNFSCTVPFGFSGRLYPQFPNTIFSPALRFAAMTTNLTGQVITGRQPSTCDLDADNNASVSATSDGLLALRWMLGMTGAAATQGALGTLPGRTDAAAIANHLSAQRIDIDGDSSVDAATDGLLLLRALLGLSGTAVTGNAVSSCATRTNWASIRPHLVTTCGLTVAP